MSKGATIVQKEDVDKTVSLYYNKHTKASYKSALKRLVGLSLLDDLQAEVLTWKDLSASTINQRRSALSAMVKLLSQEGRCPGGLLDNIVFPTGRPPITRKEASDDELLAIEKSVSEPIEVAALVILADTGLRIGSLVRIRYRDILKQESFVIKTKRGREIEIHVTDSMVKAVERLMESSGANYDDYVFSRSGHKANDKYAYRIFKRVVDRAGINVTPHQLRHGFATHLARNGVPITSISVLMGHEKLTTTMAYVHPDRTSLAKTARANTTGGRFMT